MHRSFSGMFSGGGDLFRGAAGQRGCGGGGGGRVVGRKCGTPVISIPREVAPRKAATVCESSPRIPQRQGNPETTCRDHGCPKAGDTPRHPLPTSFITPRQNRVGLPPAGPARRGAARILCAAQHAAPPHTALPRPRTAPITRTELGAQAVGACCHGARWRVCRHRGCENCTGVVAMSP